MVSTVYLGSTRTLTNEDDPFTADGTPIAVTATITVIAPDGTVETYTGGDLVNPSTGVYEVQVDLDQSGEWLYRFSGTASGSTERDWSRLYVWPDPA